MKEILITIYVLSVIVMLIINRSKEVESELAASFVFIIVCPFINTIVLLVHCVTYFKEKINPPSMEERIKDKVNYIAYKQSNYIRGYGYPEMVNDASEQIKYEYDSKGLLNEDLIAEIDDSRKSIIQKFFDEREWVKKQILERE